jgi:hypothetical protein
MAFIAVLLGDAEKAEKLRRVAATAAAATPKNRRLLVPGILCMTKSSEVDGWNGVREPQLATRQRSQQKRPAEVSARWYRST